MSDSGSAAPEAPISEDEFRRLMAGYDPDGKFRNSFIDRVTGFDGR